MYRGPGRTWVCVGASQAGILGPAVGVCDLRKLGQDLHWHLGPALGVAWGLLGLAPKVSEYFGLSGELLASQLWQCLVGGTGELMGTSLGGISEVSGWCSGVPYRSLWAAFPRGPWEAELGHLLWLHKALGPLPSPWARTRGVWASTEAPGLPGA